MYVHIHKHIYLAIKVIVLRRDCAAENRGEGNV